jgi:RNA polymerase sigma factor (sigma-70 family)
MLKELFLNRTKNKLSPKVEMKLMGIIADADDLEKVKVELTKLYKSLTPSLWFQSKKDWVPPKHESQIEDPFQNSWIRILDNRQKYIKEKIVFNWAYTIVKRTIVNFFELHGNRVDKNVSADDVINESLVLKKDIDYALEEAQLEKINIAIREIKDRINNLPSIQAEILNKFFFEEMKLGDIAKELGINITKASTLKKNALAEILSKISPVVAD